MGVKSRKKRQTHHRRSTSKDSATSQAPAQPIPAEPRSNLRENFETDVAPDRIEAERPAIDRKSDEPVCSFPLEDC